MWVHTLEPSAGMLVPHVHGVGVWTVAIDRQLCSYISMHTSAQPRCCQRARLMCWWKLCLQPLLLVAGIAAGALQVLLAAS